MGNFVKIKTMAQIAGITTKKNIRGEVTHVTIDIKKHKDKIPMLTEIGVLQKTKFQERCEGAHTVEEARVLSKEYFKNLPWKK